MGTGTKKGEKVMLHDRLGVLYFDYQGSEHYHLLYEDENGLVRRVHDVVQESTIPSMLTQLYDVIRECNVTVCSVMPDTLFSEHIRYEHVEALADVGLQYKFTQSDKKEVNTPHCFKVWKMGSTQRFIQFPAYMFVSNSRDGKWHLPQASTLLHTQQYLTKVLGQPVLYSASGLNSSIIRDERKSRGVVINHFPKEWVNTHHKELWNNIMAHTIDRPNWQVVQRNGNKGLSEVDKKKKYGFILDKNGSYLGAISHCNMGNGKFEVASYKDMREWEKFPVGFWKFKILDVSGTPFNGYEAPCQLHQRGKYWASSALLKFAKDSNILFEIENGVYWRGIDVLKQPFRQYASTMWEAKTRLQGMSEFPDRIAADNAMGTIKMGYVGLFGRFASEYSREYFHPDWHRLIIHQAIANQGYSLHKRIRENGVYPVMISTDAIVVLSDEDDANLAYPGILARQYLLAGYKLAGRFEMDESIIDAFEVLEGADLMKLLKGKIK